MVVGPTALTLTLSLGERGPEGEGIDGEGIRGWVLD